LTPSPRPRPGQLTAHHRQETEGSPAWSAGCRRAAAADADGCTRANLAQRALVILEHERAIDDIELA
jgi:hypothetical protein